MIGGFIITGNAEKKVVLRAIGPSLGANIPGALSDPALELHATDGSLIAQNDNWQDDPLQAAELSTEQLAPSDARESAIIMTLAPGTYTAMVLGKNDASGVGLVEVYDLSPETDSELANISTRGRVESAENVLIGGFILGGSNGNTRVLLRTIGPSLATAGVRNALSDPLLELRDENGVLLLANDNWKDQQQSEIEQTGIPPNDSAESAIVASLPPGSYTAIVAGKDGATGVALVEVYNLP
jgi:hypothetical protein